MKKILITILLISTLSFAGVSTTSVKMPLYTCDGSDKTFTFNFPITDSTGIKVVKLTVADGTETTLTKDIDYTVSATNNDYSSGGTVTTTTAYSSAYKILLIRNTPLTQTTDLITDSGVLRTQTLVDTVDKQMMISQELQEKSNRSLRCSESDANTIISTLPISTTRANKYLAFDATGNPIASAGPTGDSGVPVSSFISGSLFDDANAAIARATLGISTFWGTVLDDVNRIDLKQTLNLNIHNVKDYGAVGDGVTDDAPAIQAAINAIYSEQSALPPAIRGATLFFPAGVYLCKSTLTFEAYITYVGERGSVHDATNLTGHISDRGTSIRASTDIYTNDNDTDGLLVYVHVGDVTIRDISFIGCAAESGTSTGIQFGSAGGVATTGHPYETDSTGGFVGGVTIDSCFFYTFTTAWLANCAYISAYDVYFESNTKDVIYGGNLASAHQEVFANFYNCLFWSHVVGMDFLKDYPTSRHIIRIFGGIFYAASTLTPINHLTYDALTLAPNIDFVASGTTFENREPNNISYNIYSSGIHDDANQTWTFNDCKFSRGKIKIQRAAGTVRAANWRFNNCDFADANVVLNLTSSIDFVGGTDSNCPFFITDSNDWRVNGIRFNDITDTAITLTNAGTGFEIKDNYFNTTVATPYSIYAGSTSYIVSDNTDNGTTLEILNASKTYNPGSILDGDEEVNSITVTGAALGDFAEASFSRDVNDLDLSARVTDANTVELQLSNSTGGTVDLYSGTVYVRVRKR